MFAQVRGIILNYFAVVSANRWFAVGYGANFFVVFLRGIANVCCSCSRASNQRVWKEKVMKFIVWIKEDGRWVEQGDGALSKATAARIASEIRHECGCATLILPAGVLPPA